MNKKHRLSRILCIPVFAMITLSLNIFVAQAEPLTVHPTNPRYFTNENGKAIHLAGHQIFMDLQDNQFSKPYTYNWQTTLDWSWYLDFAEQRNLNCIRNWIVLTTGKGISTAPITSPMPYQRVSGYGNANDGGYKFDLYQFNQTFFDRMYSRIQIAGERGIYISIMLFDVYAFSNFTDTLWQGNVFNSDNNINGIDVDYNNDDWGKEFFFTTDVVVLNLQKAYVKKVIDTVNDLDNVIYEIANEVNSPSWQDDMVDYIKTYEASKPKQHLIMMSPGGHTAGGWTWIDKATIVNSDADCFSVTHVWGDYRTNPPVDHSGKPAFMDMDHIDPGGPTNKNHKTPWRAFTRGYHYFLYDHPFERPETEDSIWDNVRYNIGATASYASMFKDLAAMNPNNGLSSTTYCLADPGSEYLVYQPNHASFTVNLVAGDYDYEWFDPVSVTVVQTGTMTASGGSQSFSLPASITDDAVLYLTLSATDCSSLDGTCCSSGETCQGGTFTFSSDCGNLCCVGGTCQVPDTCQSNEYDCCGSCRSGHYPGYDTTCSGSQVCCDECTPFHVDCTGLVMLIHLDNDPAYGETSSHVHDFSGNSNDGTVYGATHTSGRFTGAFDFDGNDDFIHIGDLDAGLSQLTVAGWFKANEVGVSQRIASKWGGGIGDIQYILSTDNNIANRLTFAVYTSGYEICDSTATYSAGEWYLAVGTYDGADCHIYVNGIESTNRTQDSSGNIQDTGTALRIGIEGYDGSSNPFNGMIDEVAIWNRALSSGEIQELYDSSAPMSCECIEDWTCSDWVCSVCVDSQQDCTRTCTDQENCGTTVNKPPEAETRACGTGALVAHWTFDSQDISGDQVLDISGFGNSGTIQGAIPVTGRVGEALYFDGYGYIAVSDTTNSPLDITENITLSAWVRFNNSVNGDPNLGHIIAKGQYFGWNPYRLVMYDNGVAAMALNNGSSQWTGYNGNYNDSKWHHVVGVYEHNSRMIVYVDGEEVASKDMTGEIITDNSNLEIGGWGSGDYRMINGTIDDVMIWNRSLSAQEIYDLYNSSFHPCDDNPKDGCIEEQELIPFIDLWKYDSTANTMGDVMEAVTMWSRGTGCVS